MLTPSEHKALEAIARSLDGSIALSCHEDARRLVRDQYAEFIGGVYDGTFTKFRLTAKGREASTLRETPRQEIVPPCTPATATKSNEGVCLWSRLRDIPRLDYSIAITILASAILSWMDFVSYNARWYLTAAVVLVAAFSVHRRS